MSNKEKILRDLEFIGGGIRALKAYTDRDKYPLPYQLYDEWNDIIYSVIDAVEEDYERCQERLTNSLH